MRGRAIGSRMIRICRTVIILMVLEVGRRVAAGLEIIRYESDCYDFRGFESAWKGAVGSRIKRNP